MYTPLVKWLKENVPDDELLRKGAFGAQVQFVLENIPGLFSRSYAEFKGMREGGEVKVIGTHTSKSVTLPVYYVKWLDYTFTLRNNFYNWQVSVRTTHVIPELKRVEWRDLIQAGLTEDVPAVYCEGFKKDDVYPCLADYGEGSYDTNFTVTIGDNYSLYTFLWILRNLLDPTSWLGKERRQEEREVFTQMLEAQENEERV
jgi:hypothetical protein